MALANPSLSKMLISFVKMEGSNTVLDCEMMGSRSPHQNRGAWSRPTDWRSHLGGRDARLWWGRRRLRRLGGEPTKRIEDWIQCGIGNEYFREWGRTWQERLHKKTMVVRRLMPIECERPRIPRWLDEGVMAREASRWLSRWTPIQGLWKLNGCSCHEVDWRGDWLCSQTQHCSTNRWCAWPSYWFNIFRWNNCFKVIYG